MGVQRHPPARRSAHAGYNRHIHQSRSPDERSDIRGNSIQSLALSKTSPALTSISRPVIRQYPVFHVAMKRRIWPVAHALHPRMLDRIEMNVVNMPREVSFVADGMFPESSLPKRQVTVRPALQVRRSRNQRSAEMTFNAPPASGKIEIFRRQCEDRVQMLGQYHDGVDSEWTFSTSRTQRIAKKIDVFDKNFGASVCERNREEERSTGDEVASIVHHIGSLLPIATRISLCSCGLQ